jgi:hypothetical protein
MARPRRRLAPALAAAALLVLAAAAPAGALRTLHVDALSMRADRTRLHVGEAFHLAIHVRVRERVTALDELVIPDVGTMQLGGDERGVTATAAGTDVVETLTLEPTQAGVLTFNGAYLDAIDARTGKPSRFSANPVRVVVDPPSEIARNGGFGQPASLIARIELAAGAVVALLAALAAALVIGNRRRRGAPAAVVRPVDAAPPAPARTLRDEVGDALRAYRGDLAHDTLVRLRALLFAAAGANAGATVRDALAATSDRNLRDALAAAEDAAFGPGYAHAAASSALIAATQEWLR